jgi:hypothetical protein
MSGSYANNGPHFIGHSSNENEGFGSTGTSLSHEEVGVISTICVAFLALLACCIKFRHFFLTVFERLVPARNPDIRLKRRATATVPDAADSTSGAATSETVSVSSPIVVLTVPELICELGNDSLGRHDNIPPEFVSPTSTHVYDYPPFATLDSTIVEIAKIVYHQDIHSLF